MNAICFEHVSKTFPGNQAPAVDSAHLEVESGSLVVLLGPSGCGKTTLLKMVNRLYEPTSGSIRLDNVDIREIEVTALRRRIGYVIQQVGLFPHMTVSQNVAVVPELIGWDRGRVETRVNELLDLVGLPPDEYRGRYPAQLSGGQAQRVGLARALAADPKVMLLDEPFGAIDAITRTGLQDELLRLHRKLKKTILFVTHDVEEALRLADRIAVMRAGQIVQFDTPLEILTRPADPFVAELLGAGDIVRQLGLVRVETAMQPLSSHQPPGGMAEIACTDSLREALSLLLRSGADALLVLDGDQPVGTLSLASIRERTRSPEQGAFR